MNGGYEAGYLACPCFWGRDPGRLVRHLSKYLADFRNIIVLDAGCGEGKNAAFLAKQGAHVRAVDVSEAAIRNGISAFDVREGAIRWEIGDIRTIDLGGEEYDVVIAYGLLHCCCLPNRTFARRFTSFNARPKWVASTLCAH